jgi:hypothetical protein
MWLGELCSHWTPIGFNSLDGFHKWLREQYGLSERLSNQEQEAGTTPREVQDDLQKS